MARKKEKLFVLDTNVILHDSSRIYHFQEYSITTLSEEKYVVWINASSTV